MTWRPCGRNALKGPDIAGALWTALSHARCGEQLREEVYHDIHMFQHQIGTFNRADLQRLEQLKEENALLSEKLAAVKDHHARMLNDRNEELYKLRGSLMRLRAQMIARDSAISALRDELQDLRRSAPTLPQRVEVARRLDEQRLLQKRAAWQQRTELEAVRSKELRCKTPRWHRDAVLHRERKPARRSNRPSLCRTNPCCASAAGRPAFRYIAGWSSAPAAGFCITMAAKSIIARSLNPAWLPQTWSSAKPAASATTPTGG